MATNWQILCKDLFQLKVPATSCQHELDECSKLRISQLTSFNEACQVFPVHEKIESDSKDRDGHRARASIIMSGIQAMLLGCLGDRRTVKHFPVLRTNFVMCCHKIYIRISALPVTIPFDLSPPLTACLPASLRQNSHNLCAQSANDFKPDLRMCSKIQLPANVLFICPTCPALSVI